MTKTSGQEKLWPAILEAAHGRKIIVVGFSQGAVMAFLLAERHPNEIIHAFPISGMLPGPLFPKKHEHSAPISAFHGADDDTIAAAWSRRTVEAFTNDGSTADFHEHPGVGHRITPELWNDVLPFLLEALQAKPATSGG